MLLSGVNRGRVATSQSSVDGRQPRPRRMRRQVVNQHRIACIMTVTRVRRSIESLQIYCKSENGSRKTMGSPNQTDLVTGWRSRASMNETREDDVCVAGGLDFPLWRRPIARIVPLPRPQGIVCLTVAAAGRSNSRERCQDASISARSLYEGTLPRRCLAPPIPARTSAWSPACRRAFSPYRSPLEPLRISTVFPVRPTTQFRHEYDR